MPILKAKSTFLLIIALLWSFEPIRGSSSIKITPDLIESGEINNLLDQEEYVMFLIYNSSETPKFNQCLSTFHDLERNHSDSVTFIVADLSQGVNLYNFFEIPKNSSRPNGFVEMTSCQWTLNVHGNPIGFHNESHDYDSLNSWMELRVSNQPEKIISSKKFYDVSAQYFACIYGYMPSPEDTPETVERTKQQVLKNLQALASEFPSSKFFYSFDPAVNKEVKMMKKHSFVLARSFEDGHKSILENSVISFTKMKLKVAQFRFPFILWWNQEVADFISQEQKNVTILIVRKRKNYQLEATFERIARMYDDQEMRYAILEINGNKVTNVQKKLLGDLKITPKSNIPTVVSLYHDKAEKKVRSIKCDNMSEDGIKGFLDAQFGFESQSHCLQNQFLKKGWKYDYVKPVNFDLMMSLTSQITPLPKIIFFYRSKNKEIAPLVTHFIKISRNLYRENVNFQFFMFDERLNEPPQYLVSAGASVPGVMFMLPDKVDKDGKYLPDYVNVSSKTDLVAAVDKHLGVNTLDVFTRDQEGNN